MIGDGLHLLGKAWHWLLLFGERRLRIIGHVVPSHFLIDALGRAAAIGVPLLKPRSRRSVPGTTMTSELRLSHLAATRTTRADIQFGCPECKAGRPDHAVSASPVGFSAPRPGRRMSAGE